MFVVDDSLAALDRLVWLVHRNAPACVRPNIDVGHHPQLASTFVRQNAAWLALAAAVLLLLTLAAAWVVVRWLVVTARAESLLVGVPFLEGFIGRNEKGEALSYLYVTHRHRLCIDL